MEPELDDELMVIGAPSVIFGKTGKAEYLLTPGYFPVDNSKLWCSPYFLDKGYIDAPICVWRREGLKITQTMKDGRPQRIWVLTDCVQLSGYRLAVWPD